MYVICVSLCRSTSNTHWAAQLSRSRPRHRGGRTKIDPWIDSKSIRSFVRSLACSSDHQGSSVGHRHTCERSNQNHTPHFKSGMGGIIKTNAGAPMPKWPQRIASGQLLNHDLADPSIPAYPADNSRTHIQLIHMNTNRKIKAHTLTNNINTSANDVYIYMYTNDGRVQDFKFALSSNRNIHYAAKLSKIILMRVHDWESKDPLLMQNYIRNVLWFAFCRVVNLMNIRWKWYLI